jgi:D-alanine-D-alanine ligase
MTLTTHKRLCKRFLAARGFPVPEDWPAGGPRWIVKSLWEEGSVGLDDSCVVGAGEVEATMARKQAQMGGSVVAETFLAGRELNVSLLEEDGEVVVLPIAEMIFTLPEGKERIVSYRAKWEEGSVEWNGTARTFDVPGVDHGAIARLCQGVWRACGLRGYVRVDLRLSEDGVPHVLEINANPALSPGAGFVAAVEQSGRTLEGALASILRAALTP